MKFSTLKKEIIHYIKRTHRNSTWNMKYFHTCVSKKNGLKHYVIYYNDPSCKFSIHICKNNIKFHNIQNVPGAVASRHARILGPCIRFARHHDRYNGMSDKEWNKLQEANKWEQYDIKCFDHTKKASKHEESEKAMDGLMVSPSLNKSPYTGHFVTREGLEDILVDPQQTLGRTITSTEKTAIISVLAGMPIDSFDDYINKILIDYLNYNGSNDPHVISEADSIPIRGAKNKIHLASKLYVNTALYQLLLNPYKILGRNFKGDEYTILNLYSIGSPLSPHEHKVINNLVHLYKNYLQATGKEKYNE